MEDSTVKPSVAELAGKFKGLNLSISTGNEGNKPVRRRPPRTLQLSSKNDAGQGEEEKPAVTSSNPPRSKHRNSALIEKLQANLALSPTALLPSPKSPGVKLQPPPFSPSSPHSPCSPAPPQSEEETPASFETLTDGSVLKSINKGRARLSIKRRPPSRQHRKLSGEEEGAVGGKTTSSAPDGPPTNGGDEEVFEEQSTKGQGAERGTPEPPASEAQTGTADHLEKEDPAEVETEDKACEAASLAPEKEEKTAEEQSTEGEAKAGESPAEPLRPDSSSESTVEQEPLTEPRKEPQPEPDRTTEDKGKEEEKKEEDGDSEETKLKLNSTEE